MAQSLQKRGEAKLCYQVLTPAFTFWVAILSSSTLRTFFGRDQSKSHPVENWYLGLVALVDFVIFCFLLCNLIMEAIWAFLIEFCCHLFLSKDKSQWYTKPLLRQNGRQMNIFHHFDFYDILYSSTEKDFLPRKLYYHPNITIINTCCHQLGWANLIRWFSFVAESALVWLGGVWI